MQSTGTHRACDACRSLKVRCQPAQGCPKGPQQRPCVRCEASGNACVYTAPYRTKRKRTDVRVRELEEEVKSLGELLRNGQARQLPETDLQHLGGRSVYMTPFDHPYAHLSISPSTPETSGLSPYISDPIAAGCLSMQYATQLVGLYVSDLAPQRPLVVFASGAIASDLRTSRPTLFLAVLAAAAATLDESLCAKLNDMLLRTYAERIMIRGEKSLELIQALLVSANWFYFPDKYDHVKFYQQLHMAAAMALEVGLGETESADMIRAANGEGLDCERTLLGCYICCSSIALGFHRQNLFVMTPYMEQCLGTLQTSSLATPTDAVLSAWVRLQRIVDTYATVLGQTSPGNKANLSNPSIKLNLHNATKQLQEWKTEVAETLVNDVLRMQYETVLCHFHGICLYDEFDPIDFRPPYAISMPRAKSRESSNSLSMPLHISSVMTCISSAHAVLDIFLSTPHYRLRCSPSIVCPRMGHAITVLLKIHVSAILQNGALHGVLNPDMTKMDAYLEQVLRKLVEVDEQRCCMTAMWLPIVTKIYNWFKDSFLPALRKSGGADVSMLVEPLFNIAFQDDYGLRTQEQPSIGASSSATQEQSLFPGERPGLRLLSHESAMSADGNDSLGQFFPGLTPGACDPDGNLLTRLAPEIYNDCLLSFTGPGGPDGDIMEFPGWDEVAEP